MGLYYGFVILRPNSSRRKQTSGIKNISKPFLKHVVGKVVTIILENQIYFESLELKMQKKTDDQFPYYLIKLQIKPSTLKQCFKG